MSAEMHTLAAAYAIDALPADEQAFFERHLTVCDVCRADIDGFSDAAAALGAATREQPPPWLRDRVLSRIVAVPQLQRADTTTRTGPGTSRRGQTLLAAVAGVLALALVVLSGVTIRTNDRIAELENTLPGVGVDDRAFAVLAAPDAQTRLLQAGQGSSARFVYSADIDRGIFIGHGLAVLPSDRTYELWLFHDGIPHPATVFETDTQGRAFVVVEGLVTDAEFAAVTVEPHGGSPEPTGDILIHGSV